MLLNRKLIIAVLTLGLMLSFGSAAIGYDDNENYTPKVIDLGINQQGYNQFDAEVNVRTTGVSRPTNFDQAVNPLHPNFASPERICEDLRYDDNHAYYWSIPDSYATTHWAQRMTPEFGCTLISATVAVAQENGTPGLTIQVYSDAGGYPDVLVGSWDIPNASLPPLGFYGYLTVDISASNLGGAASMDDYVFAAGEDFHIAATVTGGGTVGVETLKFYSDDATNPTDRASEFMGGFWYLMVDDWGFPGNFEMIAGLCLDNSPLASDDCYEIMDWVDEVGYYWTIGPTAYGARSHVYHKVTPSTPDTLTSLDIGFEPYFSLDDVGDGTGTFPDALVSICPDDGAGFPDTLNPIYTFVVPYGDQVWMANYEVPRIGVPTPFFVDVSIPGGGVGNQLLGTITDAGAIYAGGISGQYRNDEWSTFLSWYGLDAVFNVTAYMCRDIYEECGWSWHYDGTAGAYGWGLPDTWGSGGTNHVSKAASYQEVSLSGCDLEFIDVAFLGAWGAPYAQPAYVSIYSNDGGAPGERLMYIPVSGDGLVPTGPWNIAPHYFFDEGFWIVVESFADAWDMDILSDQGTGAGPSAYYRSGDIAGEVEGWYGFPYDFMIDMYRCCKPFVIRTCAPDGDWPTMGKNDNRDNSTFNELGDIQCNLTKAWTYVNSAGTGCTFATPIIADGKVFAYMFNSLVCVDVNTGAEIWRQDINYAEIGGSCRATPTYIDDGVTPAIYCGGGDNGYFSKFNAADGTIMWGFSMNGHAQYAPHVFMTVDDGTTVTDLVVVADGLGNIYGLNTVDGSNYYYPGFNTPVWTATGQVHKALTTDGTYLYVGCDEYLTTPNFWRLNIDYTGITVDWEFAGTLGFQLQLLDDGWVNPETAQEGIKSQILYSPETDGDFVYFHTAYSMQNSSPHNGGVLYKVKADGSELMWANESNGSANGSPSGIINDKAVVIFGGYCGWIGGAGHYAGPMAYSKATGVPQWGPNAEEPYWSIQTDPSVPDVYSEVVMPGVLTCESIADPVDNDWFIFGNVDGWWNFVDATAGEIVWHRRSARFFTYVTGPIIDEAGHIIFGEQWNLHCMANDVPRQRLHIADLSPELPVPFGLPTYHEIVFEDVIANSGCTDLEIFHVELLDEDNGTFPARLHQIDNDRAENISTLAMKATGIEEKLGEALDSRAAAEGFIKSRKINTAAYALPAYILSLLEPTDNTIIPAGGSVDIRLAINGELVPRGATQFYAEIHSDDPDYFLDSAYMDYGADAADPTILLTVVGGCLYNSMDFYFGDGGANHYPIWNSTHIMIPNSGNFEIDGNADLYGSDGLFYTIDTHRVVMHAYDGGGNPIWESILPDPLPSCDFAIATDVALAEMSDDGSAYSTVLGTMVNYAYVDSVEDHRVYDVDTTVTPWDTTITWEWDLETESGLNLPYSNELTEGWAFKAHVTEYAVTDVTGPKYGFEDFWNFTISRHSLFSRYGTAIPGLYVGQVADWDVHGGGTNAAGYSAEYSASWQYEPSETDFGGGTIKIPFGPGFEPMRGTVDATTAWYGGEEPGFDSIYVWMTRPTTLGMNYMPYPLGTDRRLWCSIAELNLPAWAYTGDEGDPIPPEAFDTYGFAFFGKYTAVSAASAEAYGDMAMIINKFAGFGRGDMNDDGIMNLVDIVYLNGFVHGGGNGPFPFKHLGDVNNDGAVDNLDITYMIDWYFNMGPNPLGDWALPQYVTP